MHRPPWSRLFLAGIATAIADGLFSSVLSRFFYGSTVTRLWQGVASVLLGKSAMDGGMRTALIGLAMHICVAFFWSAVFFALYTSSQWVRNAGLKIAVLYGPFVWLVMSLIVIPLLAKRPPNITVRWWVQLIGHIFFVGLPIVASIGGRRSMRNAARVAAIFVIVFPLNAFAREPLTVGTAVANAGQKVTGWIEVPGANDEGTRIPVTIAHGADDGPVLALIAGTHGYEYTSIIALPRIAAALDPAKMHGSVILVHMANPTTFYGRRIYYGSDAKNLNRMYPGNPSGSISERIAHAITTQVIDKATHLIDMHCGDGNESLRPYSYWMPIGDERVDNAAREMVLAYGLDHIVIDRTRPTDPKKTLYTSTTAMVRGKPAITTEAGGMGLTDEPAVHAHVDGALSVINHLGIMTAPSMTVTNPVWYEKAEVLRAPVAGIWRPVVDKMYSVAKDALVGRIVDPFGNVLREIRAPFAGEMLYVVATPPVSENEPLAMVAAQ